MVKSTSMVSSRLDGSDRARLEMGAIHVMWRIERMEGAPAFSPISRQLGTGSREIPKGRARWIINGPIRGSPKQSTSSAQFFRRIIDTTRKANSHPTSGTCRTKSLENTKKIPPGLHPPSQPIASHLRSLYFFFFFVLGSFSLVSYFETWHPQWL